MDPSTWTILATLRILLLVCGSVSMISDFQFYPSLNNVKLPPLINLPQIGSVFVVINISSS